MGVSRELLESTFLRLGSHYQAQPVVQDELIQAKCVLPDVHERYKKPRLAMLQPIADTAAIETNHRFALHHRFDSD